MKIVQFLSELRQLEIQISLNGDKLKIKAPQGALTKEIKLQLKERKAEIIEFFSGAQKQDSDRKIQRIENPALIPLSFGQQRLWFFEQANPGTVANNMSAGIRLKGPLNTDIIQSVFDALIERHESLRTTFYLDQEGIPLQRVNAPKAFDLQSVVVEGNPEQQEKKVAALLAREIKQTFNLSDGPLLRVTLVQLPLAGANDCQQHVLIVGMHHIISDGVSIGVFMREIAMLYWAFNQNLLSPLLPLEIQYPDFAIWQRQFLQGEGLEKQLGYWQDKLTGAPILSTFPSDHARPPIQTSNGAAQRIEFTGDFAERLTVFANQQESTPFIVLLAAWKMLLFRYNHQQDLCVGIPTSGRNQTALEPLIGFFINSMIIRSEVVGDKSMQAALDNVKQSVLDGMNNGDVPVEMAVEKLTLSRNPAYTPLIQVAFQLMVDKGGNKSLDTADTKAAATDELTVEALKEESVSAKFDMTLSLNQTDTAVKGVLEYNTDLYTPATIERIIGQFQQLAEYLLVGDLATTVDALPLVAVDELADLVLGSAVKDYAQLLPLTAMQRDLYLSSLRNPDTLENSLGYAVNMHHKLDVDIWREELIRFSDSQIIMRADVVQCDAPYVDPAYLCIKHPGEISLEILDLSANETVDVQAEIEKRVRRPYSFDEQTRTPLVNHHIIKLADDNWLTVFATHHLVMDGLSYVQHLGTLVENYEKRRADKDCVELTVKDDLFAEYIEYDQQQMDNDEAVAYWGEQLKNVEPVDYKVQSSVQNIAQKIVRESTELSAQHSENIRLFCRKQKITPALYFKAVYALLINHYCRADNDFVLSETVAGRPKGHLRSVGCYYLLNPFVCRHDLYQTEGQVSALFQDARNQQKERKGKLQFSIMQQSQLMAQGRLGFMFNYIHFMGVLNLMGVDEEVQELIPDVESQVQFLVKLMGSEFHLFLDYHGAHFEDHDFLQRFTDISQQIVAGVEQVGQLDFVNTQEQASLEQWSQGEIKKIEDRPIQQPFEQRCLQSPDAVALIFADSQWSYAQLNDKANRLANHLLAAGLTAGQAVGICVSPSPWWIAGVLAVIKTGCRYIPIATDYPIARIKDIVDDADVSMVLVDDIGATTLSGALLVQQQLLQMSEELIQDDSAEQPRVDITPSTLLYSIYTSGSTGKPKGASVTHRNAENLLAWYGDEYAFDTNSQNLIISSPGFDLTQKNIFAPLRSGGAIVLPAMDEFDPRIVNEVIQHNNITHMNCAPSALYGLVESDDVNLESFSSIQTVLLGGETIEFGRLRPWFERDDCHCQLVNMYGPTECTDIATSFTIKDLKSYASDFDAGLVKDIPIGKPNANVRLHVLDQNLLPVVPGCVGELCISGDSVGAGYLNRDQLNIDCFVDYQGERTYKTGDLVRYSSDSNFAGNIVYVGRKDFQVKLRGLRIELDEIRFALTQIDGVKDSLALVDNERLLGFVIAEAVDENYRNRLNEYLPAYMIPSALTLLDEWPLTPNGKVDRKRLLLLASERELDYEAPETATEITLAGIWSEVLNKTEVSRNANFFDLGGHSLLATKIASRASQIFEIHLAIRSLFEVPTVKLLAAHIDGMLEGGEKKDVIPVLSRDLVRSGALRVPLSFAQQRLWLLDKIDGSSTAYNVPLAMRIKGGLDVDALNVTFKTLLTRHEGLRTIFREDDAGAYQWIADIEQFNLGVSDLDDVDLSDGDAVNDAINIAIRDVVAREILRPFDLEMGPLIRASLVKVAERDYVLIIVAHHIVTDGWSMTVLAQELATIYVTSAMGMASPLDEPQLQYLDYAQWQRNRLHDALVAEHLAYWQQDLADLPNLNLPTDFVRPAVQTYGGDSVAFNISRETRDKLEAITHSNSATLFNGLMAAFALLLQRYSGQDDFAIGTPVAGRDHPDLENLVGFFVNTLVIRMRLEGVELFDSLIRNVNQSVVNGYDHQEIPFEQIVETISPVRDMSRAPLFQAMLSYQNMSVDQQQMAQNSAQAGDISLHPVEFDIETSKFDLTMSLTEVDPNAGLDIGLSGSLQFNKDLFEKATIESIAQHFVRLCDRLAATPDLPLADLSMLTDAEINQQLVEWNDTQVSYGRSQTVHQLFIEQVKQTPDYVAVTFGEQRQTYKDLDQTSNLLATHLINMGVKPNDRIGICFDRSLHIMSSIFAVLKAGATYVPLDTSYPAGRIQYIVEDACIDLVLSRESVAANLPVGDWEIIDVDAVLAACDEQSDEQGELGLAAVNVDPQADRLLYLIYTSGSTGRPKGTGAYHYSEVNLLQWYAGEFSLEQDDRVMLMSALGFDLTQKNLFVPLVNGASLVIPTVQEYDPQILISLIEHHQVTWINCAPSAFYDLQEDEASWPRLKSLRHVFLGGEPINLARLDAWLRAQLERQAPGQQDASECKLINSYGPTECTDIAAFYEVTVDDLTGATLPIGNPNDNVRLYILDDNDNLLPVGAVGELCIAGDSVGPGYLNNAELTDAVFVALPFTVPFAGAFTGQDGLLYRTGDLARYRRDGNIEYLGRRDQQIKLRGFRIEVEEIQAVINEQPQITDSLVSTYEVGETSAQLVVWVVVDGLAAMDEDQQQRLIDSAKSTAANLLPSHMVPSVWTLVAKFPLTPNGKVDRKALPVPVIGQGIVAIAPRNEQEQLLADIWSSVLGLPNVGINQNFFELGGHSLLATKVVARVVKQTNANISVKSLFEAPTIELFAAAVASAGIKQLDQPRILRLNNTDDIPLSFGQLRLLQFDQMNPGSSANNMPIALRVHGAFDVQILQKAFKELIRRHESLRTTFYATEAGDYKQRVHPRLDNPVQRISYVGQADVAEKILEFVANDSATCFDLMQGPLVRCALLVIDEEQGKEESVLVFCMHHIISDGASIAVLLRELTTLYVAYSHKMPSPLPELPLQYADFAQWQQNYLSDAVVEQQLDYWQSHLQDAPALLTLPTDRPRPNVRTTNGKSVKVVFPTEFSQRLTLFARESGVTPFMVMLFSWQLLLSKYAQQQSVTVGIPMEGRPQADLENIIGFFINSMVLNVELPPYLSLADGLQQVRAAVLGGFANGDVPMEKVIERLNVKHNTAYTPLAQVAFQLMADSGLSSDVQSLATEFGDLSVETIESNSVTAKFDMMLSLTQSSSALVGDLEFNTDLFDDSTIDELIRCYIYLSESLLTDAEQLVGTVSLSSNTVLMKTMGLSSAEYQDVWPLTAMQRDLYLSSVSKPDTLENSIGFTLQLHHKVNVELWREELSRYANSQAILRAEVVSCSAPYGDPMYLAIKQPGRVKCEVIDLSLTELSSSQLQQQIESLVRRPYEFGADSKSDIVNYYLIKVREDFWIFVLAGHHLLMDGVASVRQMEVVADNYEKRYAEPGCQALTVDSDVFFDYVNYDRQHTDSSDVVNYWQDQLVAVEPLDYNVQAPVDRHIRKRHLLPKQHWDQLKKYCRAQKITPTLYFKVLYGLMVNHYCRAEGDFVLSEFSAGRQKGHANTMGCYYLVTPFVCKQQFYTPQATMLDIFAAARSDQKARRSYLQFSALQQSMLMPQGRIGFMYNYINFYPSLEVMGSDAKVQQIIPDVDSQVQFVLRVIGEELHLFIEYHGADFEDHDFLQRLEHVSQQIINGVQSVADLSLLLPAELDQLTQWSSGSKLAIAEAPIHRLIESNAQQQPDAAAVICGADRLSYQQLDEKANQLANALLAQGVTAGSAVSIFVSRSPWWIVGVLGVVKAGCNYVPIAADYPETRVKDIIEDSAAVAILVDDSTKVRLPSGVEQQRVIALSDDSLAAFANTPDASVVINPTDLLYTIYTSGSTGKPKGASVTHKNAENLYHWYTNEFGFDANSQTMIISSPGFDLTQKNIFAPLRTGGTIVLPAVESFDPKLIGQVITDNKITHMNCAPSALYGLLESDDVDLAMLSSLRFVLLGGETIQLQRLKAWSNRDDCQSRLVNMYGPTECTDIATSFTVEDISACVQAIEDGTQSKDLPIGLPNANVSLHVLNKYLQPVVPGCVGELCISGDSVGAGYLNRDELNNEMFVAYAGATTYRTGDLVRYDNDGRLVYIDRKDFQVKVRGYRIELGEIESVLIDVEIVRDAVVLVRDDMPGGVGLAAYVEVPQLDVETYPEQSQCLRRQLRASLPDYMLPASITLLKQLPLNSSGKVDRRVLAAMPLADLQGGVEIVAAQNELQAQLVNIWQTVLGVETLGIKQDFFELGGHSLLATKVISRVAKITDASISIRTLFEAPTIELFAEQIGLLDKQKTKLPDIVRLGASEDIPLSYGQNRLWFFDQMNAGSSANNMPSAIRVKGEFDIDVLQSAFSEVIQRHEALRTTFHANKDGLPTQRVHPEIDSQIRLISYVADDDAEAKALAYAAEDRAIGFDLENGPLVRGALIKISEAPGSSESILTFCMHHIVSDGVSMAVLLKELTTLYMACLHNVPSPLQPLPLQYADFSQWQQTYLTEAVLEQQLNYWENHLRDTPPLLTLPTDRPRPAIQTTNGNVRNFQFPPAFANKLSEFSRENGVTPFMVMLLAWKLLLSKYAQQDSISIGVPTSGRTQEELEGIIGFFINSLVLNTELPAQLSVAEGLQRVRETVLGGFANENVPLDMVLDRLDVERNPSYTPLTQATFQLLTNDGLSAAQQELAAQFGDLSVEPIALGGTTAKFDMMLTLNQSEQGLLGDIEFNTDLFDDGTIDDLIRCYIYLSESLLDDTDQLIGALSLTSDESLMQTLGLSTADYESVLPLTAMQRDLYLSTCTKPDTLENSLGYAMALHHKVDPDLWREELSLFTDSQAVLRCEVVSCIAPYADSVYLAIKQSGCINLKQLDLSQDDLTSEQLRQRLEQLIRRPYTFEAGSSDEIIHHYLIKVADEHWVTVFSCHHLVVDGIGALTQLEMVVENYKKRYVDPAVDRDTLELMANPDIFFEYTQYDRQFADTEDTVSYWQQKLASVEPLDYNVQQPVNHQIRKYHSLSSEHWADVRKFCRKNKITPTIYFKCLYGLLINHYCRAEGDFVFSEFNAGRPKGHAITIGCYYLVNPFLCKHELYKPDVNISSLFGEARLGQKESRGKLHLSIFQQSQLMPQSRLNFMYNYIHFYPALNVMGIDEEILQFDPDVESQVQIVIRTIGEELQMYLGYHGTQFEDHQFLDRLAFISQQIVAGVDTIADLSMILPAEQDQLAQWAAGAKQDIAETPVHYLIERNAQQNPDAPALVCGEETLSYQQLNAKANQLANCLQEQGVVKGSAVTIYVTRGPWWIVAVLGIVKAGGNYIPIAADYPQARVKDIIEDANAALILVDTATASSIPEGLGQQSIVSLTDQSLAAYADTFEKLAISPADVLYTIYTSGSTGKPKGASVTHKNAENLYNWYSNEFDFNTDSQTMIISSPGFDLTQKNIFAPLRSGGTIVLPAVEGFDPSVIGKAIADNKVTHINCAPSALYGVLESDDVDLSLLSSLRFVLLGGETIQLERLKTWSNRDDCQSQLVNMYGPTECTDIAASYTVENIKSCVDAIEDGAQSQHLPIGVPNNNVSLHVLNQYLMPVVPGCVGELCISGDSVGEGYLNRDELNNEVFVSYAGARTYRTGDLVRYDNDGQLVYVDRKDFQVKVRGYRIELGEIEAVLIATKPVRDAVVLVRDDMPGGIGLAAYVEVPNLDTEKYNDEAQSLRNHLRSSLPDYMVPASITLLQQLPLNPSGKVDRKALPKPESLMIAGAEYVAPRSELESALADMWQALLPVERVGVTDNFFDMGGHSLIGVRLMAKIGQEFSVRLQISELLNAPSIEQLAVVIQSQTDMSEGSAAWTPLVTLKRVAAADSAVTQRPLFFIHPIGGDVLCYTDLTATLPDNMPIYGLQSRGFAVGMDAFDSMDEMVDAYVTAMLEVQPQGPLQIAAQSLGGIIALKVADKLTSSGRVVERIFMLDTFTPKAMNKERSSELDVIEAAVGQPLPNNVKQLITAGDESWLEVLYHTATAAKILPEDFTFEQIQMVVKIALRNHEVVSQVALGSITSEVYHFSAQDRKAGDNSQDDWKALGYEFNYQDSPGEHESMMRGEHAVILGQKIRSIVVGS